MNVHTLLGALLLASVHLFGARLAFLDAIPRSRWLSGASGVSVAYVFVHLLPQLEGHQSALEEIELVSFLEHHVYLAALVGLTTFYGLERLVRGDEARGRGKGEHGSGVFWLHLVSFALYNGLIGLGLSSRRETNGLLVHNGPHTASAGEADGAHGLILLLIALALHFLVNDHGLRFEHKEGYHRMGRWILAIAVMAGWGLGELTAIDEGVLAVLFALLAGSIVLNVLKEELPEERRSRFWAFAAGAAGYSVLLLLS